MRNILVSPATGWRQTEGVFHVHRLCGRQLRYSSGCLSCIPSAQIFLFSVTRPTHWPAGWRSTAQALFFKKILFCGHDFNTDLFHILLRGSSILLKTGLNIDQLSSPHPRQVFWLMSGMEAPVKHKFTLKLKKSLDFLSFWCKIVYDYFILNINWHVFL